MGMKTPIDHTKTYPVDPEAWHRGMERIRALTPWQRALIDPALVEEALYEKLNSLIDKRGSTAYLIYTERRLIERLT